MERNIIASAHTHPPTILIDQQYLIQGLSYYNIHSLYVSYPINLKTHQLHHLLRKFNEPPRNLHENKSKNNQGGYSEIYLLLFKP